MNNNMNKSMNKKVKNNNMNKSMNKKKVNNNMNIKKKNNKKFIKIKNLENNLINNLKKFKNKK